MTSISPVRREEPASGFHHEAYFYTGEEDFLDGTVPFVRQGLDEGEPVLVVLGSAKLGLLRAALGADARAVQFAEMGELGRNPARIIPAWRDFLARYAAEGRCVRGIGEPVWPGRSSEELDECWRHEALLNLAFAEAPAFRLRCPYDADGLAPAVLADAHRTHPFVVKGDVTHTSASYDDRGYPAPPLTGDLPDPPEGAYEVAFAVGGPIDALRRLVRLRAVEIGLDRDRTADLVLAVNEVATNSLRHGGGRGLLRVWHEAGGLVCEIRDDGRIGQPLIGREQPSTEGIGGRGLWLVNQLCDLVQLRSSQSGTVVRLHMRDR